MNHLHNELLGQPVGDNSRLLDYIASTGRLILTPIINPEQPEVMLHIFNLFTKLQEDMSHESKLYPVGVDTLITSWQSGLSSVIYDPKLDRIVSHARLAPLSSHHTNELLDLPMDTPIVFELGTVFTIPECRGDKANTARATVLNLYRMFNMLCREQNCIIIGTLTNAKVASLLTESSDYNIQTFITNHNNLALGGLTCVCEINEPLGGLGDHHGINACPVRTQKSNLYIEVDDIRARRIDLPITISQDGSIDNGACHMFVSSAKETLARFITRVSNRFGRGEDNSVLDNQTTLQNFIDALKRIGHYGNALATSNLIEQ